MGLFPMNVGGGGTSFPFSVSAYAAITDKSGISETAYLNSNGTLLSASANNSCKTLKINSHSQSGGTIGATFQITINGTTTNLSNTTYSINGKAFAIKYSWAYGSQTKVGMGTVSVTGEMSF